MQLGLFFTGCSPAGGASNMWTVILGGNLDLSVTMSTTSTLAAFGKNSLTFYSFDDSFYTLNVFHSTIHSLFRNSQV